MLSNDVVLSIIVLLVLSLLRVNVVISLIIAALTCGVLGHYQPAVDQSALSALFNALKITITNFSGGLGGGAETAELRSAWCVCGGVIEIWGNRFTGV